MGGKRPGGKSPRGENTGGQMTGGQNTWGAKVRGQKTRGKRLGGKRPGGKRRGGKSPVTALKKPQCTQSVLGASKGSFALIKWHLLEYLHLCIKSIRTRE